MEGGLRLKEAIASRILILDGAMGTMIQQLDLTEADFGGPQYDGCNEYLVHTKPKAIRAIHDAYLDAGADIISTDTFGGTPLVLAEYGLEDQAEQLNQTAAELARKVADAVSTPEWPRFVAGSMGPTTKSLSVTGGATFDELAESYRVQVRGLLRGGVDVLLLETSQDMLNVKAASEGIRQAFADLALSVPVIISGTIEPMGTTLGGQNIEAFYLSVEHLHPLAVGLNCATGPEFMRDHIRTLSGLAESGVSCYPNAGLPDENGHYHETPAAFATKVADFAKAGWLNLAGGCCGTTPDHIRALRQALGGIAPRTLPPAHTHAVSGLEPVYLEDDNRPVLVGERTNVIGSRKFRKLIAAKDYETAAEVARAQVRSGAQVVDVCLADPDSDEVADMAAFLPHVVRKVKVPFMIDSTDANVVETALKMIQGKAIINSTNLEDGEPRLARFAGLAKQYGAALVVGTIDEKGMAVTRKRKLEVALRSYDLLVHKYGIAPSDIIFDPLTFPCGTGDENYIGSARETVEGIRLLRDRLPECPTILGVSNVSFGLPPAGREVLNSVFLYECTKAGLGYAIVNAEKLERYASIPEHEKKLAERLLFETSDALVAEFTAFYRDKPKEPPIEKASLPLDERLARCVVDGTKEGLIDDLDEALKARSPLEVINGPLMDGMNEVGRLFNNNELIVAEVLQSAEVMKAAVAYLEPKMEKSESANKGTVLLATVKGDVHDIGKNLVEIILANNGFKVVNLGIKVPPNELIEAAHEHKPDMIGLSGLLVKSAQQMVITAEDLTSAGVDVPVLVGGAALTKKFSYTRIQPAYKGSIVYAKDAMEGLAYANRLVSGDAARAELTEQLAREQAEMAARDVLKVSPEGDGARGDKPHVSDISRTAPVFTPPDLTRHVLREIPLSYIRPYLNLQMLLGKHLGLTGNVEKRLAEGDEKAVELLELVDDLIRQGAADGFLKVSAVYQFFPAVASGDEVLILHPEDVAEAGLGAGRKVGSEAAAESGAQSGAESGRSLREARVLERFHFPRQQKAPYLCLADFLRPIDGGVVDYVAMLNVTAGTGVREVAEAWKASGDYLRAHALQAVALELAEASAERIHHVIRDAWGFPDPLEMTMRERFIARYQGIRVSFGYPACPNLDDQAQLFRLLQPFDIGVELTDGFMMEPEASVSALVFSHPEARYFNVDIG
ncbi:methionine synthase [Alicyclobacillus ferrooxydans]|uniref:Methionine synthase n=1 Tax=Alicyclobacillus ferrooxydans TaxID=471514 RepID=A0A0P9D065_9BACL|nr:methionine synthase [Alicyclobacillus ferrooxydans]KPV42846.1 methionine synthase [Alicyclobacillus ferrooxydans]